MLILEVFNKESSINFKKLKELFKVEFGIQKRFPKKDNEKTSYGGIEVIEVPIEKFKKESSEVEILPIRNKDEIF